jgi:putative oxidoreductase
LRILDRLQPLALLVMRVALGAIFIAHGAQKVFGGMQATEKIVSGIGFPWWMAFLVAVAELGGGILVLLGLLTRLGALAICVDMGVAIAKVHWSHGLKGPQGFEFPMACAAIAFALIFFGAGPIALDSVLFRGGGGTKGK